MYFIGFLIVFLALWALLYPTVPAVRHGGRLASRLVARNIRIERFVQKHAPYLPIAIIVVSGLGLTAFAGDQFLDLAENLRDRSGRVQFVDTFVHDAVVQHRTADATTFFALVTAVGSPIGMLTLLTITTIALLIARRFRWAIYLAVTTGGAGLLDFELKRTFARARPAVVEMLRHASGYSFPSGHAMGSTVAFAALTYLSYRLTTDWKRQSAATAFSLTFILAVSLSRVYLGVHWISDVGAGIAAGLCWVTSTTVAYEMLRRVRRLRALRGAGGERRVTGS